MPNGATVHTVMRSYRTLRGGNHIPRQQRFRVAAPLNGMITPQDLPKEFWGLRRISFRACPVLAQPKNQEILSDAVRAFKRDGIVKENGADRSALQKDTWANIAAQILARGTTFTFVQSGNRKVYLDISTGNGHPLRRRLFLGKL